LEITPQNIRIRKTILDAGQRMKYENKLRAESAAKESEND
jgi:hypothetical protein